MPDQFLQSRARVQRKLIKKLALFVEEQHSVVRPEGLQAAEDGLGLDRQVRVKPLEDLLRHAEADLDVLVDADVDDPCCVTERW